MSDALHDRLTASVATFDAETCTNLVVALRARAEEHARKARLYGKRGQYRTADEFTSFAQEANLCANVIQMLRDSRPRLRVVDVEAIEEGAAGE